MCVLPPPAFDNPQQLLALLTWGGSAPRWASVSDRPLPPDPLSRCHRDAPPREPWGARWPRGGNQDDRRIVHSNVCTIAITTLFCAKDGPEEPIVGESVRQELHLTIQKPQFPWRLAGAFPSFLESFVLIRFAELAVYAVYFLV